MKQFYTGWLLVDIVSLSHLKFLGRWLLNLMLCNLAAFQFHMLFHHIVFLEELVICHALDVIQHIFWFPSYIPFLLVFACHMHCYMLLFCLWNISQPCKTLSVFIMGDKKDNLLDCKSGMLSKLYIHCLSDCTSERSGGNYGDNSSNNQSK
jgi:hypothetical protein